MKIDLKRIKVKEVFENYVDNKEEGVLGYNKNLNIRPKYQREFVYDEKKRNAVIHSIINGFPLNVMYWVKNIDGGLEMLDGQQRTISICQYVNYFHTLPIHQNLHDCLVCLSILHQPDSVLAFY